MNSTTRLFFCSAVLPLLFAAAGCAHSQPAVKTDDLPDAATPSSPLGSTDLSSDHGNAYGLQTVHFEFDSSLLSAEAKKTLHANADVLKQNPTLKIQIEGHCDQRGGIQYNIALGEKRAKATEHFLEDLGIPSSRISTISFGKEHPVDASETEEAYAKNRRANFVVTKTIG
jgi:peptidoglycan-associated lipoprotein